MEIINHSKYTIDQAGNVYSNYKNRPLKQNDNNGYKMVFLKSDDNIYKWHYIHRLVAIHFIDNTENKEWVNHKDGNKANNNIENLEWTTISENIKHSFDKLGRKQPKGTNHYMSGKKHSPDKIKLFRECKLGSKHPRFKGYYITPMGTFDSISEAALKNNTYQMRIYRLCKKGSSGFSYKPI